MGLTASRSHLFRFLALAAAVVGAALGLTACGSGPTANVPANLAVSPMTAVTEDPHLLREGDTIKLTFPGAPNLDTTQKIRRDGKIALPMAGEVSVVGRTPIDLEKELSELYSKDLVTSEVYISVVSSSYPVFVTGAVIRPGKIETDRPITALEAIMEAGGFQLSKANTQAVVVVRHEREGVKNYTLNLQKALQGAAEEPFYLRASDIVFVPERFAWF